MATTHIVTAPLVIAKTSGGGDQYLYSGAVVPDGQSLAWLKSHLNMGMIAKGDAVADPTGDGNGGEGHDERTAAFLDRPADEVIADVATLSDDDRAAAISAEEAGKGRVTVLRALHGDE